MNVATRVRECGEGKEGKKEGKMKNRGSEVKRC